MSNGEPESLFKAFYPQHERRWLVTPMLRASPRLASGQRLSMLLGDDHLTGHLTLAVYLVSRTPNQDEQFLNYFPAVNKHVSRKKN